ncbi:hypothetical protein [Parachryseolinea silvisoli]|uniref:hypothetical protein n=1 Tax=Parachryseolinea silvisoli TaxID=2873601 RepID=UPI0022658FE1|nr:hypothetical protein [Parachryseolinea silvisoli]MCD9015182.1 hypothetical protein [Parachryseolinea silvisoli]
MKTIVKQKSRYELQRLENIILEDLADFFKRTPDLEYEFLPDVFAIVNEEVQNIKENLSLSPLAFDDPGDLRRHVQSHQHALLTLAGYLRKYAAPSHLDYTRLEAAPETFSQILYQAIEDLLDFLHTRFPQHFDHDAWIPPSYQQIVRHHLCGDLSALRTELLQRGINLYLVAIAMVPLTQFAVDKPSNRVSYRTIAYLQQLRARLSHLATTLVPNPTKQLLQLLCELNFNSPDFVTYCISYMKYDLHNTALITDGGPMILYRFRKLLLQMRPAANMALNPSLPPLQDTLCTWIDTELWYCESIQRSHSTPPTPAASSVISKIFTSLTGAELSYLFSIMLSVGIVIAKNKRALGNILAAVFQTANAGDQGDSYRQQLYRVDMRVKKAIESFLTKMLKYVQNDIATNTLK